MEGLQIRTTAIVAPAEGAAFVQTRLGIAELFVRLFVSFAAISGMQRGLEAGAKIALVVLKILAARLILLLLDVAQAEPPHFPRAVEGFGAGAFEDAADDFLLRIIFGDYHDHGAPVAERIFVDDQFVSGQALRHVIFNRAARDGAESAEQSASQDADREDRANPGSDQTGERDICDAHSAGEPHGASHGRSKRLAHAGLLRFDDGNPGKFAIRHLRSEQIDAMFSDAERRKLGAGALRGRTRLQKLRRLCS